MYLWTSTVKIQSSILDQYKTNSRWDHTLKFNYYAIFTLISCFLWFTHTPQYRWVGIKHQSINIWFNLQSIYNLWQFNMGPSWLWSYGSWIYNNLCNQCLSPLKFWVWIPLRRGVLDSTLCDKVCRWLPAHPWFYPLISMI